jgi:hypothetical protein
MVAMAELIYALDCGSSFLWVRVPLVTLYTSLSQLDRISGYGPEG